MEKVPEPNGKEGSIEKRPYPWVSAVTIVAKPDGTLRFCIDHRSTKSKNLIKSWPMPSSASHRDTVGGARYIIACNVHNSYNQIPVASSERGRTHIVPQNGEWVFIQTPTIRCFQRAAPVLANNGISFRTLAV